MNFERFIDYDVNNGAIVCGEPYLMMLVDESSYTLKYIYFLHAKVSNTKDISQLSLRETRLSYAYRCLSKTDSLSPFSLEKLDLTPRHETRFCFCRTRLRSLNILQMAVENIEIVAGQHELNSPTISHHMNTHTGQSTALYVTRDLGTSNPQSVLK